MQSEVKLPPVVNKRAFDQWEIISRHVNPKSKFVLDLGCGYADLLWSCWAMGAAACMGVDKDRALLTENRLTRSKFGIMANNVAFTDYDINDVVSGACNLTMPREYGCDIILCFSVLPYLDDMLGALKWIKDHSKIALLEVQYFGDGPGRQPIRDDGVMSRTLSGIIEWEHVKAIGKTYIPDRDKYRTIWMCEK